jgi:hypothetical protein
MIKCHKCNQNISSENDLIAAHTTAFDKENRWSILIFHKKCYKDLIGEKAFSIFEKINNSKGFLEYLKIYNKYSFITGGIPSYLSINLPKPFYLKFLTQTLVFNSILISSFSSISILILYTFVLHDQLLFYILWSILVSWIFSISMFLIPYIRVKKLLRNIL